MADAIKYRCWMCGAQRYSKDGIMKHVREEEHLIAIEDENYSTEAIWIVRENERRRDELREEMRRKRVVDWECEQAAGEMESIDTVEDFLRACGGDVLL